MSIKRNPAVSIVGALAVMVVFAGFFRAWSDEDDEKPVSSHVAQVFRDSSGDTIVAILPAAQKEIGIATRVLEAVARPVEVEAYGFVLDPESLAALNSKIVSAQAALDAAAAQYHRTSRLYAEQKNASLRELQTEQASYLSDNAMLQSLEQQLRTEWGGWIARMNPPARAELINALVDHRQAIARVTAPLGEELDELPAGARVRVLGHESQPLKAQVVYNAPTVIPSVQGQTFLVLLTSNKFPVRPGMAVSADLPAANTVERGVMVPRSAVVRYAGADWVYRQIDQTRFERMAIAPAQFTAAGCFVTANLSPGMRIVVTGAQSLLSEELKSQIQIQD